MSSRPSLSVVLNERFRTLVTDHTVWSVQAKHDRIGGDVDVILGKQPKGRHDITYLAFRRNQGEWTQLAGMWVNLPAAVRDVQSRVKKQVFAVTYVTPLLVLAARLGDHTVKEAS